MRDADRHGRARRADGDRRRRPADGFRARDERRFEALTEDALTTLPAALLAELDGAALRIEDIPPAQAPAEDREPPMAHLALTRPRRLTVYRRTVELRASSRLELTEVLREAAARAIVDALGLPEPDWDEDW
jgi:hypothetical protein